MITEEKIKIYTRYKGDIDGWARTSRKKEQNVMEDSDWYLIEALIQDIQLVKKGLASSVYSNNVNEKLTSNCDSVETIKKLKAIAEYKEEPLKDSLFAKIATLLKRKK